MILKSERSVQAKIRRLHREITAIDQLFYLTNQKEDPALYAAMLERKRDDMIRAAVLQLHTSIENILDSQIMCCILGVAANERMRIMRRRSSQALRKMLGGADSIGFDMKLNLAVALRLMTNKRREHLAVLNTLRNKCSHNWLLKAPVRRGRRPRQMKPPLLLYNGRDLHGVSTFQDFISEYGPMYARMFVE
jgi:uncharacterized protein with von Willebrand factor type A (vWA) domain